MSHHLKQLRFCVALAALLACGAAVGVEKRVVRVRDVIRAAVRRVSGQ